MTAGASSGISGIILTSFQKVSESADALCGLSGDHVFSKEKTHDIGMTIGGLPPKPLSSAPFFPDFRKALPRH